MRQIYVGFYRGRPFRAAGLMGLLVGLTTAYAQFPAGKKPYTSWSNYGGSVDSMQYSALDQINKGNVSRLEPAWFHPVGGSATRLVFNPVIVDDVMYVRGERGAITALDAATGRELWTSETGGSTSRGICYWESPDRSDRRLITASGGGLRQINAKTGELITTFGENGRVNMRVPSPGNVRALGGPSGTPVRVFENLIITGSNTGEGYGSPPGDIRAYDVRTGELVWTFRTIPVPGDFGYETWPTNAYTFAGGANCWGEITVDEKNAIVFVPTGSPTADLYGSDRPGDNLFGNSLLALDARTGKRLWHFQTIHHDQWDWDLTSAPNLLTVRHNGKMVDIVAQAGKTGLLYVFHRLTGEPLWPIIEQPVPKSDVPGEASSPTQPIPTKPPPFSRHSFTVNDINPYVDAEEYTTLLKAYLETGNNGVFTPSSQQRYQLQFPGAWGGANWGSTAADPATGMLFVRSLEQPSRRLMRTRGQRNRQDSGQAQAQRQGQRQGQGGQTQAEGQGQGQAQAQAEGQRQGQGRGRGRGRGRGNDEPELQLSPLAQKGQAHYMQICVNCHGRGAIPMRSPAAIGIDDFRTLVREGRESMPALPEEIFSKEDMDALEAYFASVTAASLASAQEDDSERASPDDPMPLPGPPRYSGPEVRYSGSAFAAGWYTEGNRMPAIGPPWTQLVAYDLNEGTIKWRVPDGTVPSLVEKGITDKTGAFRPRNGPVVTAGGLVFIATSSDGTVRAYDKDDGRVLWEHRLEAAPEGIPSVYEVGGRQYVVFGAGAGRATTPTIQGKIEAQGYHVFALPAAGL